MKNTSNASHQSSIIELDLESLSAVAGGYIEQENGPDVNVATSYIEQENGPD